jgi:hypothetical protein
MCRHSLSPKDCDTCKKVHEAHQTLHPYVLHEVSPLKVAYSGPNPLTSLDSEIDDFIKRLDKY